MRRPLTQRISYPIFALGGALLWGMIEFVALCRSRCADWMRAR